MKSIFYAIVLFFVFSFVFGCDINSGGGSSHYSPTSTPGTTPSSPSSPSKPSPPTIPQPSKLVKKIESNATAIEWTRDKSVYGDKPVDVYMVRMNVAKEGHRANSEQGKIDSSKLHYLNELFIDGKKQNTPPLANMANMNSIDFSASNTFLTNKNAFGFFANMNNGDLETLKQKFSGGVHPTEKKQQLTKADFDEIPSVRRRMFTMNKVETVNGNATTYVFEKPFEAMAWSEHCIVWIPATDFDSHNKIYKINDLKNTVSKSFNEDNSVGITRSKITATHCRNIVEKFEVMYPYLTAMFGDKSKYILYPDGSTMDIEYFTDIANFTNILIYDSYVTGGAGDYGSFSPTDYAPGFEYITYDDVKHLTTADAIYRETMPDVMPDYSVYQQAVISNMCNVFNINSRSILSGGVVDDNAFITIAHEYMHSLQFARKVIEGHQPLHGYKWSYAFGEMLGCLCEDVIGDLLGVPPEKSVLNMRLSSFISGYSSSGVLDLTDDGMGSIYAAYGNVTAFGVFLTRNFGGPRLLSEMVKNKSDGWDAIIDAVRTVTGKQYTKEGLVRDFCESILCKNSAFNTNKKSDALNVNGTQFVMNEVNFFDLRKYYPNVDPSQTWLYGISALNSPYENKDIPLRPDGGIHLCLLAKKTMANKVQATFDTSNFSSHDPNEIIYIMVDESRF